MLSPSYFRLEDLTKDQPEFPKANQVSNPCLAENLAADSDDSDDSEALYTFKNMTTPWLKPDRVPQHKLQFDDTITESMFSLDD